MYLVLAIILGIILFSRVQVDKATTNIEHEKTETRINDMKLDAERFAAKYVDRRLEDAYWKEILEGTDFSQRIRMQIKEEVGIEPTMSMILVAMLAESCKVTFKAATFGIGTPYRKDTQTFSDFCDYCKKYQEFIIWYNDKLIHNGMEHELVYVRDDKHKFFQQYPDRNDKLTEVEEPNHQGVYFWFASRFMVSSISAPYLY